MPLQVRILVKRDELTLEGIKQFYVNVVGGACHAALLRCQPLLRANQSLPARPAAPFWDL